MKFLWHEAAGETRITLKDEPFKYLVKVRRHQTGDRIDLRRREEGGRLFTYVLASIEGRRAELELANAEMVEIAASRKLHIAWCMIDPKSVEKVLPQLNEIGVERITFVRCDRSQKQHVPDMARLERILENSMQQCGRSREMQLETADSLEAFLRGHPETVVLDFCEALLGDTSGIDTVLIGCEGGFSSNEKELMAACRTVRFDTPMILRSETAAVAIAAKILM